MHLQLVTAYRYYRNDLERHRSSIAGRRRYTGADRIKHGTILGQKLAAHVQ